MHIRLFPVLFVLSMMMESCTFFGMIINGSSTVQFSLDTGTTPSTSIAGTVYDGSRSLSTSPAPNEIIYVDASQDFPRIQRAPLGDGVNELALVKGGVHLVGFVYNPANARSMTRSTASSIQTIGNLQIVAAGLDSVPLSSEAADEIDLGQLAATATGYTSPLTAGTISAELGYDQVAMETFGTFDNTLMKFLNPDINGDGIYDQNQFFTWKFRAIPYINLKKTMYDFGSAEMSPDFSFSLAGFQYVLDLSNLSGYPVREESYLLDDIRMTLSSTDGSTRTFISHWVNTDQVYFMPEDGDTTGLPADGSYTISLPKAPSSVQNLSIANAVFLKPEDGFTGLPFPVTRLTLDSTGRTTSIAWKWMIRDATTYRTATHDEVERNIRSMNYSWELQDNPGQPIIFTPGDFSLDGEASLASARYDSLRVENLQCLYIDCVDLGWNYYKFNYYMNGEDDPALYGDAE